MIWDCFLFLDELDMLECRLRTLDEVVDRFVMVEGDLDNNGVERSSCFLEHKERFEPWADRLVYVWATDLPFGGGWECEFQKRQWMMKGLEGAADTDVVLISDCDEIPHPENLRDLPTNNYTRFEHKLYCFAVDWLHPRPWIGTIAAPYGVIDRVQDIREMRHHSWQDPCLTGNWHFSWVGGTEQNYRKLNSSHDPENQGHEIRSGLEDGNRFLREGVYIGGVELEAVEVDDTWPAWIAERKCPPVWFRENHNGA